ncbi:MULTISPECIES: alpha/beta fold hydrolase [Pseudomonas]|uniref:Alpha/beta hydrolase n=4 Tax=Pseudomonas TaxID=286 RepID=V9V592_9PSED|nr:MULTISPECIES: alpha/beta hydrolase [Pseudomonas]ADN26550.1 N-formylmaleamate deformylase [Pseudomonas putida S16]AEJ14600.1 deformylase [Pseudomonas putida S16]AHC84112.1 alpha/beta hydrolase [Pseudomonas monteilii SB3078]AHC89483.1 alpha/beta hydrolase [Pseudomonas monteilii SB3101]ANI35909.1 alpha/beta hydrolase [Pseudomonas sp. JY-Q]
MKGYNVYANGIRQHIIHFPGTGSPLLLIPGITSPAVTWGFVAERLAKYFDVHVVDVRGRGLSESGDLDYSLDAMADDLVALAQRMEGVVVLGHSMGARIAIRAARKDSQVFSRLILVDPPVSGPGRRPYPAKWSWYAESIRLAQRGCTAMEMRSYCPTWTDEQIELRAEWLHTCQYTAVKTAFDGFHTDDIHTDLAQLTLPIQLVVAGGAEVIQPDDIAEIISLAPQTTTYVVEEAGHMIPWDNLEGFITAVSNR